MLRRTYFLALSLLLGPVIGFAGETPDHSPAFTAVSELTAGFDLLYEQKFAEAREVFASWQSRHPDQPFAEVAIAASYLFEELSRQGVLTSDFFLNEKKFLRGILARERQKTDPKDGEALFALTLASGMESNEESILQKRHLAALRRTKEANEYAKRLLAQNPEATDAYVALGMANYIIGSLGPASRFTLWFGGIHGDKKIGMEQLAKTTENGLYLKPFAKIVLALAARREKQDPLAQKLLRGLTEQYPGNELFASEYAKASGMPLQGTPAR